jgi:hypothetical protein
MTKQELIEAAYDMTGGNVADLSMAQPSPVEISIPSQ